MQNELKTAIRFENFWEAFGPSGVIALAWWMGARHAADIRKHQSSFPILHIEGPAGSGKTTLQTYLWKLLGQDDFTEYDPFHATRLGRPRALAHAGNGVVSFGYEVKSPQSDFDWDELLPLFNGGKALYRSAQGVENISFSGAVMISSQAPMECSNAFQNRVVRVLLIGTHDAGTRNDVTLLNHLTAEQGSAFCKALDQESSQTVSTLTRLAPAYAASILDRYPEQLSRQAAKNGGQLMAMVDVLSLLLGLSEAQRRSSLVEVMDCIHPNFVPF
ncbi:hypothetical protein [Pseudomonas sp. B11(2017)]|uniref:hypothetical protein n=1 Tax=Pseudomonas sp. B11(2017) TaxID=1981748 RepID=UPI000A1EDF99|nr:hypothetical protein [Pseudomonas sp. B11(2017)]